MKPVLFLTAVSICSSASAMATPQNIMKFLQWEAPGQHDQRSPCPILNALANHKFLPHDGKNITVEMVIDAFDKSLNIDADMARFLYSGGLPCNPVQPATSFSLADLSKHNVLEHDGSLSRQDVGLGSNSKFDQKIFDQTTSHWPNQIITLQQAANARAARVATSKATDPHFTLANNLVAGSYGETANYIITFGDRKTGETPRAWIEYLFEKERLPVSLGWWPKSKTITLDDSSAMAQRLQKATCDK